MRIARDIGRWMGMVRRGPVGSRVVMGPPAPVRIGLALGGGFARGIAHAGLLRGFEVHGVPIHCIAGISAGAIVASAYASGATPAEIARAGCSMRFTDVGRWSLGRLGFVDSERMVGFLRRLLKCYRFEEMRIPLGVLATDLGKGSAVCFHGAGDVFLPVRASCSYPGLFRPVSWNGRLLVDGAIAVEAPAGLCREMGATHVISVHLPAPPDGAVPTNVFQVVNRAFQIMQTRNERDWRAQSDLVIAPDVGGVVWDDFASGDRLVKAGEAAALAALPAIRRWLPESAPKASAAAAGEPDSVPA